MIQKILIFFTIPFFFHLGYNKSITGLYIIIFLSPYEGLTFKHIQLSQFAICAYFAGSALNHHLKNIFKNNIFTKYILILILLFLFGFINFLTRGIDSNFMLYHGQSTTLVLRTYIANFITSILLFILLLNYVKTFQHIKECLLAFILSISYFFVTWFFNFILYLPIPNFLKTVYAGGSRTAYYNVPQFGGYTGETGLTMEYTFFVLVFSLFFYISSKNLNKKLLYITIMIISIIMGISTLMKTYYLALIIFILILLYFYLKEKKLGLNKKFAIIALISVVIFFVYWQASNSYIVHRFEEQIERTETSTGWSDSKLDVFLNRPYEKEFINFWEECGLTGIGTVNALGVRGNHLATHSHYYDLFMKYGLIGLFIYLLFYFKLLKGLFLLIQKKYNISSTGKQLVYILFGLLLSLLVAQYARSYQNQTSFMLNYWFLFGLIVVIVNKPQIIMKTYQQNN